MHTSVHTNVHAQCWIRSFPDCSDLIRRKLCLQSGAIDRELLLQTLQQLDDDTQNLQQLTTTVKQLQAQLRQLSSRAEATHTAIKKTRGG